MNQLSQKATFATLTTYEVADVIEALRRDMRRETELAISDPQWADWHQNNARHDRNLLQLLNPKSPQSNTLRALTVTGAPERYIPLPATQAPEAPVEH